MEYLLEELGLTQLEVKIYNMLLNEGESLVGKITQKTGIHRRNVYDCLERLIQKGLVAYIKENNRKVYSITNPQKLSEKLEQQKSELDSLMPDLLAKFNAVTEKRETLFFRGIRGVRQIFMDQINVGEEILVNATTTGVDDVIKFFFPKYQLLRKENKIPTRMLFDASYKNAKNRKKLSSLPYCKYRFVEEYNKSPMSTYIYGDNVAIVVWGHDPIAILIRQKEIAEGFRQNFEVVWSVAK